MAELIDTRILVTAVLASLLSATLIAWWQRQRGGS